MTDKIRLTGRILSRGLGIEYKKEKGKGEWTEEYDIATIEISRKDMERTLYDEYAWKVESGYKKSEYCECKGEHLRFDKAYCASCNKLVKQTEPSAYTNAEQARKTLKDKKFLSDNNIFSEPKEIEELHMPFFAIENFRGMFEDLYDKLNEVIRRIE